jgi:hypothetical protein
MLVASFEFTREISSRRCTDRVDSRVTRILQVFLVVPASGNDREQPPHWLLSPALTRFTSPASSGTLGVMQVTYTAAGTPVIDLTPEEEAAYLEREVQSAVGMSVAEFRRAYSARELDDVDVAVEEMVSLLRIGQNVDYPELRIISGH